MTAALQIAITELVNAAVHYGRQYEMAGSQEDPISIMRDAREELINKTVELIALFPTDHRSFAIGIVNAAITDNAHPTH